MSAKPKGTLVIIGGHEDKENGSEILSEVARIARVDQGQLVLVTVATQHPDELAKEYQEIFKELGVPRITVLDIRTRDQAYDEANVRKIADASLVFFTGGDQLRITSQIGDSPVFRQMRDTYHHGGTVVGTSAGAAAMPANMLIDGPSDESPRVSELAMAPGLGLIDGVIVDSHFAERGRMGRLLGVVAQNPQSLGLGIDEDTAILVKNESFQVIGSGATYVVDGSRISYSSLSEEDTEGIVTIHDVTLHVLGAGECFDLKERRPLVRDEAAAPHG